MTEDRSVTVPLDVVAALYNGCRSTVRLSNDGWEPGDEHAAKEGLAATPVWLSDQIEAHEEQHRPSSLTDGLCGKCGKAWPCH